MRVADFVADFIYKQGVEHVFFVTGAGIMHLTDGVACHEKLKAICPHHEQSASMAIDAYSRASSNFAAAYFTTGPGGTNAITGLAGAWQDSVPCLFISGQVKRAHTSYLEGVEGLRQHGVQELNVKPIVESITKYSTVLNDANDVRYELEKATYIAKSGRPGPVWIDIPMDIQASKINDSELKRFTPPQDNQKLLCSKDQIDKVAKMISISERPVIIAGQGVRLSGAISELDKLAKRYQIPVVSPYLGIDNLPFDHEQYIGKTGVKGDRAANFAMQSSDLIISVGSSLHITVIGYEFEDFARAAKKVIVDIDTTSHKKKTIQIDELIESDAKFFLSNLFEHIPGDINFKNWSSQCNMWKKNYPVCLEEYYQLKDEINIYAFINELCENSNENDIFISDAGSAFYAVSQGIKLQKGQRYIPSSAMATMGFSLPAAIGAAFTIKNTNQVVHAITGDGSFQQNLQELSVLTKYNLPIKLYVLNNRGYLSIRNSQKNYFESRFIGESEESGLFFPDLAKLSDVYSLNFRSFKNIKNFKDQVQDICSNNKPEIIEIICPQEQPIVPTVSSKVNSDGSMSSRPLEDMFPFLPKEEYRKNVLIDDFKE